MGETSELAPCGQLSLLDEPTEDELSFAENPVAVVAPDGLCAMGEVASALGYLWVPLEPPGPAYRGRLGLFIEESIERELEDRGALAPGIQSSTGLDASLSDQLYRARLLERRGLAVGIPDLTGISNLARAMDAEDSAVLRWWIAATSERPVRLVISQQNLKLRVFPSPVLFHSLLEFAPRSVTPLPAHEGMAQSSEAMELSDLPPQVQVEEDTSLFGTEIGPLESHWGGDVELPALDAALGLCSKDPALTSEQLALSYQSSHSESVPPLLPPEVDTAPIPGTPQLDPDPDTEVEHLGQVLPVTEARGDEELECDHPSSTPASGDNGGPNGLDDLDADDFLRTLAEDSEKAPPVVSRPAGPAEPNSEGAAAAEKERTGQEAPPESTRSENEAAQVPTVSAQPTSQNRAIALPTKKIIRRPFIRLAEAGERTSADGDREPQRARQSALPVVDPAVEGAQSESSEQGRHSAAPSDGDQGAVSGDEQGDPSDPFNQLAVRQWKSWVKNLEAARGPKPLSVIERMFVTDYTRLKEAVRRGIAEPSAEEALIEWRRSFSNSYSEAFDALRVRGKRPTMVLDLPELAARLGRLQGAARVQLLLVDGMRFDLGLMIQDRMRNRAGAALTERLLLWSALPSITSYQLELLAKGPDGLKEAPSMEGADALVARGRAAATPRRVRAGALEILKLDIVEDALRKSGVPVIERMDGIADDASAAIIEYLSKQPPRTMVVVFGDHGFDLDPKAAGTTEEVIQGGATPEEVLVPAFAWLTGAMH